MVKIIELVEEAQDSKSAAERLIDRFATYYTPLILVLAVLIGLITKEIRLAITLLVLGMPRSAYYRCSGRQCCGDREWCQEWSTD